MGRVLDESQDQPDIEIRIVQNVPQDREKVWKLEKHTGTMLKNLRVVVAFFFLL